MGKGSAPKPPDPYQTAAAQTGTNVATARANNAMQLVNQVTPYGKLTYRQTGRQWIPASATVRTKGRDRMAPDGQKGVPSGASAYAASPAAPGQSAPTYDNPTMDPRTLTRGGDIPTTQTATQTGVVPGQSAAGADTQADLAGKGYYVPTYTARTSLSKPMRALNKSNMTSMQNLADLAKQQTGFLGNYLSKQLTTDGLPKRLALPGSPDYKTRYRQNFSKDRRRVESAMMSRMQPQLSQDRAALEQRLADQGIGIGTEAYTREMSDFDRRVNDARTGVILAGGQEQSRLAGLARDQATFGNNALTQGFNADMSRVSSQDARRGSALSERFALRNQPLNEIAALLSGSQVSAPNFPTHTPQAMPTVDQAGLIQSNYKNQVDAYNAQQAQRQSLIGGGLGLLSKLMFASDPRLKRDAVRLTDGPLPVWSYRYAWEPKGAVRRGYMATDVLRVKPEAVGRVGPFMAVDYAQLPEVA